MAFATYTDLENRFGITMTSAERTRAAALIADAQRLIQDDTGQTIELVSNDSVTLPGAYTASIRLPQRPVVSVASVVLDGSTLTAADDWYVDGDDLVRTGIWPASQNRFGISGAWGDPSQALVVTYTHGWAAIPGAIKAVCLEMVGRVWVNPGATSEQEIGNSRATYAAQGLLMTEDERQAVRGAIRRQSASVVLR